MVCSSWFLTRSSMRIQAKEEQPAKPLLMKPIPDSHSSQFLLPFGAGFLGPPLGTRDWSIVRLYSSSPPMGC